MSIGIRVGESTTAQERVFSYLLDAVGEPVPESVIRAELDLPRSTTHRALSQLLLHGLIAARDVGRTKLYSVDPEDPLVRHLKIARNITLVRDAIADVRQHVELAILFGSGSRGENGPRSDLDVLLVTRAPDAVLDALSGLGWLQPIVMTPSQHMGLLAEDGTLARATTEGIVLWRST
jgi:predicted nucleotidyltransferase